MIDGVVGERAYSELWSPALSPPAVGWMLAGSPYWRTASRPFARKKAKERGTELLATHTRRMSGAGGFGRPITLFR